MTATVVGSESAPSASAVPPPPVEAATIARQPLLTPEAFPGQQWVFYPGKKDARLEETWTVVSEQGEPVLVCRGEPHGYLRTRSLYQDFELGLEWKFPTDEHGNSGVLMFTSGEDRIWPTAVQVQLHKPKTGSVFGSGGAQVEMQLDSRSLMRPVNHWNELQVVCRQGVVRVAINGKDVGDVRVISPQVGSIGLQSEGSEVHFRHLWIRDLQPVAQAADASQPMSFVCPPECPPWDLWSHRNAPTYGVWKAYSGQSGWSWTQWPAESFVPYPTARKARHVAHGNTLAGGDPVYDSGRRLPVARGPAGEWEIGAGRHSVRAARGGRNRR